MTGPESERTTASGAARAVEDLRAGATPHAVRGTVGGLPSGRSALIAVVLVVDFVQRHPYWSAFLAVVVVVAAGALLSVGAKRRARQRAEQAERDRAIAVTDAMTGSEFEQWFARLLGASGFRDIRVRGGSGDRGADVTAIAPDGSPGPVARCTEASCA
ncbi:restriction endonuclease [Micromonospora sp. NPDC023814]|uniref:restriction endonuclease n=1 Tax=Micromonospora sp. NPDC023814 TaxID=3154596 RepID=UPI00340903A1